MRKKVPTQPQKLKKLLKLVNLVKQNAVLPDGAEIARENYPAENENGATIEDSRGLVKLTPSDLFADHFEVLAQIKSETAQYPNLIEDISKAFCDIEGVEYDSENFLSQYLNYNDFLRIRAELNYIVLGVESIPRGPNRKMIADMYLNSVRFNTHLIITDEETYSSNRDILEQTLEGVHSDRLRACKKCGQFFWAKRVDQQGCSATCADNIRIKRKRKKDAAKRESII